MQQWEHLLDLGITQSCKLPTDDTKLHGSATEFKLVSTIPSKVNWTTSQFNVHNGFYPTQRVFVPSQRKMETAGQECACWTETRGLALAGAFLMSPTRESWGARPLKPTDKFPFIFYSTWRNFCSITTNNLCFPRKRSKWPGCLYTAAPLNCCPKAQKADHWAPWPFPFNWLHAAVTGNPQCQHGLPAGPCAATLRPTNGTGNLLLVLPCMYKSANKQTSLLWGEQPKDLYESPGPRTTAGSGQHQQWHQWRGALCTTPHKRLVRPAAWAPRWVRACADWSAVPEGGGSRAQKTKGRKRLAFLTLCWQWLTPSHRGGRTKERNRNIISVQKETNVTF